MKAAILTNTYQKYFRLSGWNPAEQRFLIIAASIAALLVQGEMDMKKIALAVLAATLYFSPAQAGSFDWWLVNGAPGASSVDFVDVASINESGHSVSFKVATYWRNGKSEQRKLTMNCGSAPASTRAVDLWKFVCGSEEHRMESGMIVDANSIDWVAKTVFEMPS